MDPLCTWAASATARRWTFPSTRERSAGTANMGTRADRAGGAIVVAAKPRAAARYEPDRLYASITACPSLPALTSHSAVSRSPT